MRHTSSLVGLCLVLSVLLSAPNLHADLTVRECIAPGAGSGKGYLLAADGAWRTLGSLQFNHQTTSDYVVGGMVDFTEGNTPNARVEYQFLIDGQPAGWYTRRVPAGFPTTQILRVTIPDVAGGTHTLGIRARNLSSSPVYYNRFWLTPLLVEGSETRTYASSGTSVSAGSAWTQVLSRSITPGVGKMVYLSGFLTLSAGTALSPVEYRFTRNGVEIDRFEDTVPGAFPDGRHLAFIDRFAPSGSTTYGLDVRSPSGASVTVASRDLAAQTLPSSLTVFEATGGALSVPNDDAWHTLAATPWVQIAPASIGTWGTDGSGFAHATYNGAHFSEAQLKLEVEVLSDHSVWEVGWVDVHTSGREKLEADQSDWEQLGFKANDYFQTRLVARGLCQTEPAPLTFDRSRFQILVLPDNTPYTHHSCSVSPGTCCTNNSSSCLAYSCTHSGELPLVTGLPSRNCF